jgi:polyribonucleotide nucleotidyltransferase
VGHGYLAEKSFNNVLPDVKKFPYTIRTVSDVLESNGSSSMATVCAVNMALMDGGVPISEMISGIAIGLIKDSKNNFHILSDILGIEDALGLMDFKVTGTEKGIMAIQMDIKAKSGLTKELLSMALKQAKIGRLHILSKMKSVLASPKKDLSELAPRVEVLKIPREKIGVVIGPAGKVIKDIIAQTGVQIDVEDTGLVTIYSKEESKARKAIKWIKILTGDIEVGSVYQGIIKKIADFGIFVELVPGREGLVHISTINRDKQRSLHKNYKFGDTLKVKVLSYDRDSERISLIAPELK